MIRKKKKKMKNNKKGGDDKDEKIPCKIMPSEDEKSSCT